VHGAHVGARTGEQRHGGAGEVDDADSVVGPVCHQEGASPKRKRAGLVEARFCRHSVHHASTPTATPWRRETPATWLRAEAHDTRRQVANRAQASAHLPAKVATELVRRDIRRTLWSPASAT
jgi:hypothetical protein